eukprot:SAG31_NODE_581_length_13927_cov_78.549899_3_plen_192_part_00
MRCGVADTGNLHKWAFTPKGCAFLWVSPVLQSEAQGPIISHAWRSDFQERFYMQGTLDDTAFLCVPTAFRFIEMMGGFESIYAYNHGLIEWAAKMLAQRWGTEVLIPTEYCSTMACIKLPTLVTNGGFGDLFGCLWDRFGIVCPVVGCPGTVGSFVRISAQIYNERNDYEHLAAAVLELQSEAEKKLNTNI